MYQKYVIEGLTCEEISKDFSTARTTILKYLKEFGIATRNPGSNHNRKRGLAYGEKSQQREIKEHKRELQNIQRMRELREKGFSYWKIADVFNSMGIPTKSRKGKWHPKTIQQILK